MSLALVYGAHEGAVWSLDDQGRPLARLELSDAVARRSRFLDRAVRLIGADEIMSAQAAAGVADELQAAIAAVTSTHRGN